MEEILPNSLHLVQANWRLFRLCAEVQNNLRAEKPSGNIGKIEFLDAFDILFRKEAQSRRFGIVEQGYIFVYVNSQFIPACRRTVN
jgi:hypothetical protein